MTRQFMHLDLAADERPPCRWAAVDNAIHIACNLRCVEVKQIEIHFTGCVLASKSQIVEHHRGQVFDECRIALFHLPRQTHRASSDWNERHVLRPQQKLAQSLQGLWSVVGIKLNVKETECRSHLFHLRMAASKVVRSK